MPWQRVASFEDLQDARPWLPRDVDGEPVVLANADGTWYALSDICTHAGCSFSDEGAELLGPIVECACHGSEFDIRTGAVVRGPAELPIRTYAVRETGDGLEIEL